MWLDYNGITFCLPTKSRTSRRQAGNNQRVPEGAAIADFCKLSAKLLGVEVPAWVPDCAIDCMKLSGKSPSPKGARPSNLHDYVGRKVAYRRSCASYFVSATISCLPCKETTVHGAKPLDDGCLGFLLSSQSKEYMDCCTKVYIIEHLVQRKRRRLMPGATHR